MQHFQSILIIIGVIAIAAVLLHGYFSVRKDKLAASESENDSQEIDMFAEKETLIDSSESEEISEVRIIADHHEDDEPLEIDFSQSVAQDDEPVSFNVTDEQHDATHLDAVSQDEPASIEPTSKDTDTFFDTPIDAPTETMFSSEPEITPAPTEAAKSEPVQQDLFIFNVVAREEGQLGGHELLQFFLTSGFRFGEMSIFHRHENSDGTGPVLFSIANMMAPGVFEPDCMEQFQSQGVSFFLTAPNDQISIKKSFSLMLRAVEQMAEEFDCEVLNADRKKMTTEQFIEYNNRLSHYS